MVSGNMNRYRHEQEVFVSNHSGSTSQEIVYAILPNVCSILLATTTFGIIGKYTQKNVRIFLEFVLVIIPCILCCTVLSDHVISVCLAMLLISALNILFMGVNVDVLPNYELRPSQGKRPFLTHFRALTNIMTCICILAIDFHIFPRKFAKTEVFGYSLMDAGVGVFVLANALVAAEARDFDDHRKNGFIRTLIKNMKTCTRSCVPLLILGYGRFLAVEYSGYQKHVTEYGIHWNFFLTLAFVKLFTSTITSTVSSRYALLSGMWVLAMHEYILSTKGVKEWVLSNAPRIDFVTANREGLVSIPGYVGLYLIGIAIGRVIHSTYRKVNGDKDQKCIKKTINFKVFKYECDMSYNESMVLCIKLSLIAVQACACTLFCDSYFGVSRRLANAGYCTWIITLGSMMLTLLLLLEVVVDILIYATQEDLVNTRTKSENSNLRKKLTTARGNSKKCAIRETLEICDVVDYNGLFFFLFCNLMTGIINMSIRTLYVEQLTAVEILVGYMAINILSVFLLYRWKLQIKL